MIDAQGYRANAGIVLCNAQGKVFWGRRPSHDEQAWQFPQGGINHDETPLEAMYRELYEEIGLSAQDVKLLGQTQDWLSYEFGLTKTSPNGEQYIGQKQLWFLLELLSDDSKICLTCGHEIEFDAWHWVDYWYPLEHVVAFKRAVYQQALTQLLPYFKERGHA